MNKVKLNKINRLVSQVLSRLLIDEPPINVEEIVNSFHIEIRKKPFNDSESLSGVLIKDGGDIIIGVNANHSEHRQRFTIAHELGHFLLHENDDVVIDKDYTVYYRDSKSSMGIDTNEIEANAFASMLLIPEDFLIHDLKNNNIDIFDLSAISKLADKYNVSPQAMNLRIVKLMNSL